MKIEKLKLTNFRGARDLTLDLSPKLEVFYGENGAGKSTVIDALARMLTWVVGRIQKSTTPGRPILEDEITNGMGYGEIEITAENQDLKATWSLVQCHKGIKDSDLKSDLTQLKNLVSLYQAEPDAANFQELPIPVLVNYPVNRAVTEIPIKIRHKTNYSSRFDAYDQSLTGNATFKSFFEWFREREDLENEAKAAGIDQTTDYQLEAVRQALSAFLPEFKNFRIRRQPLKMEVEKKGSKLSINQLSDGEKCLIAMIGDLARRLAIANPDKMNPVLGEGVVLIDEVDLHLHPTWQRLIVPGLLKTFPNCQFILTTHSPHVITHVRPENLYLLRQSENGMTAERPNESYGKTVDRILEDLMGLATTRPNEVTRAIRDIYLAIDKGDLNLARKCIADLEPTLRNDPDIVRAETLMRRMEFIGK